MGLLHANPVRYFIRYSHRDNELDYESDIDEFSPKYRRVPAQHLGY